METRLTSCIFPPHSDRLNRTMQYGNRTKKVGDTLISQFKSYYVVWKPLNMIKSKSDILGLNRTMQYGNFFVLLLFVLPLLFKSYYVVWKPSYFSALISFHCLFKSYYVVWKLLQLLYIAWVEYMFKSYYVVWKHHSSFSLNFKYFSLNRTMQYGNCQYMDE